VAQSGTGAPARNPLRWFLTGVGSWSLSAGIQQVVFTWLVVGVLHESPDRVGLAQMFLTIPNLLFILFGGLLADRVELRRLLITLHLAAATSALVLATLVWSGRVRFEALLFYAVGWGTIQAFGAPARDAMLSHLGLRDLMRAVTAQTLVLFSGIAVGSRLGGLGSWIGTPAVLGMQAAIVLAGILAVARLPRVQPLPHAGAAPSRLHAIREGLLEVRRSPRLFPVALLVTGNGLFFMGPFNVQVPLMLREFYGGGIGLLSSVLMALPLGTIAGSLAVLLRGGVRRRGLVFLIALFGVSGCLLVIAARPPFPVLLAAIFAWGIFHSLFFNTSRALFQEFAPPAIRARVLSVHAVGFLGMAPISHLGSGLLADAVGPLAGCAFSAVAMILATGWALFATPVRRLV
jgi:predicted MFS family arabinose efflux permease